MLKRLTTIASEIIHENPWWTYKHDTYTLPNGEVGNYYYGEQIGSVLIIPIMEDGKIMLIRQFRYLHDRITIEFPMGSKDKDESAEEAANREFLEETGMRAKEMINVSTFEPMSGRFRDYFYVFIARDVFGDGVPHFSTGEEVETMYRRPDEIESMIQRGEITDGPTLSSWALARHRLL